MEYDVFISYSRKDMAVADRICRAFDEVGIKYFIDRQGIGGAFEFPEVLAKAIVESSTFLLLASDNSYNSKFTMSEVTFAFNKKSKNSVLPYLIDDTPLPLGLQFVFSSINWRNIKDHPIETVLVDDILRMVGRTRPAPKPTPKVTVKPTPAPTSAPKSQATATTSATISATPKPSTPPPAPKPAVKELTPVELYNKAVAFNREKKYSEAAPLFRQAAEKGHADAQNFLGIYYSEGNYVTKNEQEAVKWYKKSADQGNKYAQSNLAYRYLKGEGGVEKSKEKALELFQKSAEQGLVSAQYKLGSLYSEYVGTHNKVKSFEWYKKAADQKHADACYEVGVLYLYGADNVVEKNEAEAFNYFKISADQGCIGAFDKLGDMYREGKSVKVDLEKAVEYYQKYIDKNGVWKWSTEGKIKAIKKLKERDELLSTTTSAPYKIGDFYNEKGKRGIVFDVSADGKHGKIVSLEQMLISWSNDSDSCKNIIGATDFEDGARNFSVIRGISNWKDKFPVFAKCAEMGEGWYVPAVNELEKMLSGSNFSLVIKNMTAIAQYMGEVFYTSYYWSSTEKERKLLNGRTAYCVRPCYDKDINDGRKSNEYYLRAVAKF